MKGFLGKDIASTLMIALVGFLILNLLFENSTVIALLNALFIGVFVAVTVAWAPLIWATYSGVQIKPGVKYLVMASTCGWLALGVGRVWSIVYRSMGSPVWLQDSLLVAISVYLACLAGILQIAAPDIGQDFFHMRMRRNLWLAIAVGGVMFVVALFSQLKF